MKHQTISTPSNRRSIWLVSVIAALALAMCAFASLALSPQLSLATDSSSTPASSSSTNSTTSESSSTTSDSSASTSSTESTNESAGQPSEITERMTTSTPLAAAAPANATENDSTANADENDGSTDGTTTVPGTTPATQNTQNTQTAPTTVSDTRPELTLDQGSASFISRSQTITYTINQMVSSDVNSLVITDTLEGVMGFVSTNENVSVIWNGTSIAADVQIDGQTLNVTIQDATSLRGHAVTVSFQAKVLDGVDITPYANGTNIATIPNSAYATLYGDTERTLQSDPKEVKVSLGGTTGSTGATAAATTTASTRATATTTTSSSTVGKATAQTGDSPLLPMTAGVLGLLSLAGAVVALRRQASTN